VTEANKNSVVYTFARGAYGTTRAPFQVNLSAAEIIASPALIPSTTVSNCGTAGQQVTDEINDLIFPTNGDKVFDGRQPGDGTAPAIRWNLDLNSTCSTPGECNLQSAPASITDLIIFGGGDGKLYITDTNGNVLATFPTGDTERIASGPAISHSQIFFGAFDKHLYAYSLNGQ
jgi:outer membrane protein assembly factor BamB